MLPLSRGEWDPLVAQIEDWREYAQEGIRQGGLEAPVVLVEFSDVQCPYCGSLNQELERLREEFGQQLTTVFRHYPLTTHEHAFDAARIAQCAFEQGVFPEMRSALFAEQENFGGFAWRDVAEETGVGVEQFDLCLDSDRPDEAIQRDIAAGEKLDIGATPALLVNGDLYIGLSGVDLDALIRDQVTLNQDD